MLQWSQIAIGEINNSAAAGANQVMMVFYRSSHEVASAAAPGVDLADKAQPGKQVKGAVDGYQPNAGVFLMYPLVYCRRGEMVLGRGDCLYHHPALWGKFVAVLF